MNSKKSKSIIQFFIQLGIIVLAAYILSISFFRIDLTSEKRYSLTQSTIELMENLDNDILVRVYLKGDYPADFKRLENATRELLEELRSYSNDHLEFVFINPSESSDKKEREKFYGDLMQSGLLYTNLPIETSDGIQEKILFPGALISLGETEIPIQILKGRERVANASMINQSINNLEYEFTSAFQKLLQKNKKSIAFIEGHGELASIDVGDITASLKEYYNVDRVMINENINSLSNVIDGKGYRINKYDLILVAKPQVEFSDKDRFILDQYIMHGGKVIWMIDGVVADMDSLRVSQQNIAPPTNLRLEDMLFNYGARINKDLILDKTCAPIMLNVGNFGDQAQMKMFPWYFNPILIPLSSHPIVSNVDPVLTQFASSVDAVGDSSIHKTVLLESSELTRIYKAPARINLAIVNSPMDFSSNAQPFRPVAILLEGEFESFFKFSLSPALKNADEIDFKEKSIPTKMIIIGDGDIIRNTVNEARNRLYPLGYDKNAGRVVYGNKDFFMNAVNFLLSDQQLISIRSKTITLRQLNIEKVKTEYRFWQLINLILPIFIIILMGIGLNYYRKKKYQA
jgi:ABC-2 type transport system permease protein